MATQGISPRTRDDANLARFGSDRFVAGIEGDGDAGPTAIEVRWQAGREERARERRPCAVARTVAERHGDARLHPRPARCCQGRACGAAALRRPGARPRTRRARRCRRTTPTTLGQRNAALRRVAEDAAGLDAVEPWTARLVEAGAALTSARAMTIEALRSPFAERAADLGLDGAVLGYQPSRTGRTCSRHGSRVTCAGERRALARTSTRSGSRPARASSARTGRRASSAWPSSPSCSRRPSCLPRHAGRSRSFSSTTSSRSSTATAAPRSPNVFEAAARCS